MITHLAADPRVVSAARLARSFPALSPLRVLELSDADYAILAAAHNVITADEERVSPSGPATRGRRR